MHAYMRDVTHLRGCCKRRVDCKPSGRLLPEPILLGGSIVNILQDYQVGAECAHCALWLVTAVIPSLASPALQLKTHASLFCPSIAPAVVLLADSSASRHHYSQPTASLSYALIGTVTNMTRVTSELTFLQFHDYYGTAHIWIGQFAVSHGAYRAAKAQLEARLALLEWALRSVGPDPTVKRVIKTGKVYMPAREARKLARRSESAGDLLIMVVGLQD